MPDRKIVTIKATALATVHETWRFSVPADWEQGDLSPEEVFDGFNADPDANDAALLGIEDNVTNETDREVTGLDIAAASAVANLTLTPVPSPDKQTGNQP